MASFPTPAAPEQAPEQRIADRYIVRRELARGGMGVVYEVHDSSRDLVCALKCVRLDRDRGSVMRAAFEREYQVLASLDHPGIISVYDYGVTSDGPYYTMELVGGSDLRALVPLPWRAVCLHLRSIASALSLLHARRLLHRDLSPGNVRITPEGHCKLLDFGALSDFGYPKWVIGTPPLIAPEALGGALLDQRTDLYALGALAYWALTGRHAYPARFIEDLRACWRSPPPPPSIFAKGMPGALDALVMSMLSANPLARPASAAEVIAHLNGIADLAVEPDEDRRRLARSFLATPPFVGRDVQIDRLSELLATAVAGHGASVRVEGVAGSGRTRLLEETGVRAQIAGAAVVRVDASMHPTSHGTSRALTLRLFEALPESARKHAEHWATAINQLGIDLSPNSMPPPRSPLLEATGSSPADHALADWFLAISREHPLVIQVDNVAYADDASLGLLLSLARSAATHPLLVMLADQKNLSAPPAIGLRALRDESVTVAVANMSGIETLALIRSMFGEAPNVARFADWMFDLTAGNPLLCVELSRQLVDRGTVRYEDGMWVLPTSRPKTTPSARIEELLSSRIASLSPSARALAQCLGLQQMEASFELCVLVSEEDERRVRALLDELAHADVVQRDQSSYRFSSTALRQQLLAQMDARELRTAHLRLGRALAQLARNEPVLVLEAGWHLIQGGADIEGAELIERTMQDSSISRILPANMYRIGRPLEAALYVFKRHRRSSYQRLALLASLTNAAVFEDPRLDEEHSDDALDVLDFLSGMQLARRLRWLGRLPALIIGLLFAVVRFYLLPKRDRPGGFGDLMVKLFGAVSASAGVAAMRLECDRAARLAEMVEPFSALPAHLTAPSIYRFCDGLQQIGRENQAPMFASFDTYAKQLDNPRYFPLLPGHSRNLLRCGVHFARGSFAVFRHDGSYALESIATLQRSGLRFYEMVGSQLHFLYHANRGELALAAPHRQRVELHAAHFGSAWQVEMWEAAALLPLQLSLEDPSEVARLAHRLEELARTTPSMHRYARLGRLAISAVNGTLSEVILMEAEHELDEVAPRSFVGWCTTISTLAKVYNDRGQHTEAMRLCSRALTVMTDADRDYVSLFLSVDIQAAYAETGLRRVDAALARIDGLLARFDETRHPLALGLLHEARGRIAWKVGRIADFERSLLQVERWFGDSTTPALVAKCERLRALSRPPEKVRERAVEPAVLVAEVATEETTPTDEGAALEGIEAETVVDSLRPDRSDAPDR